jgi:hypothetical protein
MSDDAGRGRHFSPPFNKGVSETMNPKEIAEVINSMFDQAEIRQAQWTERFDRLNQVLGGSTVPMLRRGLKAVTGHSWRDAKSDELMRAADAIVTGTDQAKKAILIAAVKRN